MRTFIGVLLGLALIGGVVVATLRENSIECEVCVRYHGLEMCNTSTAGDRDRAVMQATSSACSQITDGVTDGIRCSNSQPLRVRCD